MGLMHGSAKMHGVWTLPLFFKRYLRFPFPFGEGGLVTRL